MMPFIGYTSDLQNLPSAILSLACVAIVARSPFLLFTDLANCMTFDFWRGSEDWEGVYGKGGDLLIGKQGK
jgi:hypothetical protein